MHWYLALIYEPEHVVTSPGTPSSSPPAPASAMGVADTDSRPDGSVEMNDTDTDQPQTLTASEQGVEDHLLITSLRQSCSINNLEEEESAVRQTRARSSEAIAVDSDHETQSIATHGSLMRMTPEASEVSAEKSGESKSVSVRGDDDYDIAIVSPAEERQSQGDDDLDLLGRPEVVDGNEEDEGVDMGINPVSFYGSGTISTKATRSGKSYIAKASQKSKAKATAKDEIYHPNRYVHRDRLSINSHFALLGHTFCQWTHSEQSMSMQHAN